MRFKKLKLSGFKSFVDPISIPFPSNLTAVVGPNGCGKSNIIDAVRWVMGESSAKLLRGESMADVIFNGSTARKPVGQASVELLFDNSDGSLTGEYINYNEIAIKRQVNRDGQSHYYLNNTRCRRKDITDIFLGTGLGPRSYAIIEQGMVSRLIEAKPDELRLFLEEAAGISKYKDRRRETETRIRHTRENLDRLNDIREELTKQLERLNRQAKAAEKYKVYREEERLLKAQHLALRWQTLEGQAQQQSKLIKEQELQLESHIAEQRHFDNIIEQQRIAHTESNDAFNTIQAHYYSINTDIARLEEAIQHQHDKRQQLQNDLLQIDADLTSLKEHFEHDQQSIETSETQISHLTPKLEIAKAQTEKSQQALQKVEQEQTDWQSAWDDFNASAAESSKSAHVEQTRIQHLEERLKSIEKRINDLQQEQNQQAVHTLEDEIKHIEQSQTDISTHYSKEQQHLEIITTELNQHRENHKEIVERLNTAREQLQNLGGRHASLEALQQAALGKQDDAMLTWLENHQLTNKPRLVEDLTVADGWDTAVETVLGDYLQAVCVDGIEPTQAMLDTLEQGHIILLDTHAAARATEKKHETDTLASKVKTSWTSAESLLAHIYIASSLTDAIAMAKTLDSHESVVTRDGIWISNGWLRLARDKDEKAGIIHREQELRQLQMSIEQQTATVNNLEKNVEEKLATINHIEKSREEQQRVLADITYQQAEINANLRIKHDNLEQLHNRAIARTKELDEQQQQAQSCQAEIIDARNKWQEAMENMDKHADVRDELLTQRDAINLRLDTLRQQVRQHRENAHRLELELQTTQTQFNSLQQNIHRLSTRVGDLELRRESLAVALEKAKKPDEDLEKRLQDELSKHKIVEEKLEGARAHLEDIEQQLQQAEEARSKTDQSARAVQGHLEQLRMDAQTYIVRRTTIEEQLAETQFELKTLLNEMPEDAAIDEWNEKIDKMATRVQRLGAINLAAIEEYKVESERKAYLDAQNEDLTEALQTLENAIRKIDRETRQRFKETYTKVNTIFQELFPRLFDGGHAYLELTGDDLLDTGVIVMAQPPGKRNSNIHLLSGGEKALAAIALVFAIFRLNPSPFCMLDEVDAPLDDTNVERFCRLVKDLSDITQFIFITHNKITMELAHHLAGVTMHEPGVSRMVSVDIDEAIGLTEEA